MLINEICKSCLLRKNIDAYPETADRESIARYQRRLKDILEHCDGCSTPQIAEQIYALQKDAFGVTRDYAKTKRHYNELMLSLYPHMKSRVDASRDRLKAAVQFAMVGNYIDFGASDSVDETALRKQLDEDASVAIDPELLNCFGEEVHKARRLVLFTDNCGEIVTDKLLVSVLRQLNPELSVTVIVRGQAVLNDATMEDAMQVHMEEAAQRVIGNGRGMPGNVIGTGSPEAAQDTRQADLLISKGQGNFEGLSGCGLNIFYLFLCKCDRFMNLFQVPQFTGVMTREGIPL